VFNWFSKKERPQLNSLLVDIHSHLLPEIDDGVKSFEESAEIIQYFSSLGYRKLITTPHVISDAYRNTPVIILQKLDELRNYLQQKNITMQIDAAAEYYLDEELMKMIQTDQKVLTFGKNYLLFETNFLTEPLNLKEFIFLAATKGYKLILAHPERYMYMQQNFSKAEDILNRGVLFQVNISSLTGHYSKPAQQMAEKLIDKGWVHWLGSDCHQLQHAKLAEQASKLKSYRKALSLPLLNNSLS
jgi:protein-tyrosine phosphatase